MIKNVPAACVMIIVVAPGFAAAQQRPNIVLIFADDLGWKDVGYNGSELHETPNLDRLAKEGMVFHQAYAAAGNCAPSRACLLSGNYTPRRHVYAVGSTDRGPKERQRLVPVRQPANRPTIIRLGGGPQSGCAAPAAIAS